MDSFVAGSLMFMWSCQGNVFLFNTNNSKVKSSYQAKLEISWPSEHNVQMWRCTMDVEWRIESLKTSKIIFQLFANLLIFGLIISVYAISQKKGVCNAWVINSSIHSTKSEVFYKKYLQEAMEQFGGLGLSFRSFSV